MKVRKAVVPAAGLGTRFLPASRSVPKEMLPIFDRPMIHYIVEEAAQAGIQHTVMVVSQVKEALANYFDRLPDIEEVLKQKGNIRVLEEMRRISNMMEISYVRQKEQLGLGHAILTAKNVVGREPFAVFLPDDIIWDSRPTIGQMMELFERYQGSIIAVKEVPDKAIPNLGIIRPKEIVKGQLYQVLGMVEKPRLEDAPSNLAIIGRYVLTPEVFDNLERVRPGALGEIQLTDGIAMLTQTQKVYAYRFPGTHFDVGAPLGLLKASIHAALKREDIAAELEEWIKGLLLR